MRWHLPSWLWSFFLIIFALFAPSQTVTNLTPTTILSGDIMVSLPVTNMDTSVPATTIILQPVTTAGIDPSLNYIGFQGRFTFDSAMVDFAYPATEITGLTGGNGAWEVLLNTSSTGTGTLKTATISASNSGI